LFWVTVTIWDTQATTLNADEGDIMAILRGKIIDYNNVNKIWVSSGSSKIMINPESRLE